MLTALKIVLTITSLLLVVLILLQKGKGGGLSSLFGGGVQSNLSGSITVEKNLQRYTVVLCVIWTISIVALNLITAYA